MKIKHLIIAIALFAFNICNAQSSWENYIKNFPRKASTEVRDYNGNILKSSSLGVLDVPINSVQQCADAAIRLRAEYFYERGEYDKISFKLTSGLEVPFTKWAKGYRIKASGNSAKLVKSKDSNDYGRENFEAYLKAVMTYAGSASLYRDLEPRNDFPHIGDMLVLPGYPGHVVIVIDRKIINGINYYLFANSWIPAQDIEIISGVNPAMKNIGNYMPMEYLKDPIFVNGYCFHPYKDTRKWQSPN